MLITFIILFFSSNVTAQVPYTFKDLQILHDQKSFVEYLGHAKDVPPSQRGRVWSEMTQKMGHLLIEDFTKRGLINPTSFKKIEDYALWPVFKSDEVYQIKREEFALKFFNKCVWPKKTNCLDHIKSFWSSSRKAPDVGFKLAELTYNKFPEKDYWEYIDSALRTEIASFECHKDYIFIPLFEKAAKIVMSKISEFDKKVNLQALTSEDCYEKVYPKLRKIMTQSPIIERKEESFLLLNIFNQLSKQERERFLVTYLLSGPTQGDTFNMAWNNLKALKEAPETRKNILMDIMASEFIPDSLFNAPNIEKKITLIEFISKTFPELLESYAKTCLNYYQGRGAYPYGNPTRYCKEFIQLSNGKNWVSPKTILNIKNSQQL
jgi:hypothetical protein